MKINIPLVYASPEVGNVVTFYSFKGGVGRSMALANIAVLLARAGKRVLCIDWDLEAPGLDRYFRAIPLSAPKHEPIILESSKSGGLLDILEKSIPQQLEPWRNYVTTRIAADGSRVEFIGSGDDVEGYSRRLANFSWPDYFAERGGGDIIEALRAELKSEYDFILLDSRTGLTDSSGICTIHMPDLLILLFAVNYQSIDWCKRVADSIRAGRRELPYDRAFLPIIPVLARFDAKEESDSAAIAIQQVTEHFSKYFSDWLPSAINPRDMLNWIVLPYIPRYSFYESLAVEDEAFSGPDGLAFRYSVLFNLIQSKFRNLRAILAEIGLPGAAFQPMLPPISDVRSELENDPYALHRYIQSVIDRSHEEPLQAVDSLEILSRLASPPETERLLEKSIEILAEAALSDPKEISRLACKIIRVAGRERNLSGIGDMLSKLPEGDVEYLYNMSHIKKETSDISALQIAIEKEHILNYKKTYSAILVDKIENFSSWLISYPEPLGGELRQAAIIWLEIAKNQYHGIRHEFIPQFFRAGVPVSREREAYIPRSSVLDELNRILNVHVGCFCLVIYGRRRIGKTTLLRNLEGFLPVSIQIGVLSMQNPIAFISLEGWLTVVSEPVLVVWPERERPKVPDSLPSFFRLLGECNQRLEAAGQRLLLAIDEYENLDRKLGEGVFPLDLLHMLRESIQTHRRIVWLFAGSHTIEELTHAEWPSYLISASTVEVPAFTEAETRLLLTEPMKHSRLFERDESKRPRFEPGFWGEDGIARIQAETAGWPHLVQLLAETAVDLCNERQSPQVDAALLDDAIAKAVTAGDTVLRQLLKGESTEADWAWLVGFRRLDALPIPEDEAVFLSLRRRWLVVDAEPGEWRLRVPLLLRWLRERG